MSGEGSLPSSQVALFSLWLPTVEGARGEKLLEASPKSTFMGDLSSWPNALPEAPAPNTFAPGWQQRGQPLAHRSQEKAICSLCIQRQYCGPAGPEPKNRPREGHRNPGAGNFSMGPRSHNQWALRLGFRPNSLALDSILYCALRRFSVPWLLSLLIKLQKLSQQWWFQKSSVHRVNFSLSCLSLYWGLYMQRCEMLTQKYKRWEVVSMRKRQRKTMFSQIGADAQLSWILAPWVQDQLYAFGQLC